VLVSRARLAVVGAAFAWLLEGLLVPVWQVVPMTEWLR